MPAGSIHCMLVHCVLNRQLTVLDQVAKSFLLWIRVAKPSRLAGMVKLLYSISTKHFGATHLFVNVHRLLLICWNDNCTLLALANSIIGAMLGMSGTCRLVDLARSYTSTSGRAGVTHK